MSGRDARRSRVLKSIRRQMRAMAEARIDEALLFGTIDLTLRSPEAVRARVNAVLGKYKHVRPWRLKGKQWRRAKKRMPRQFADLGSLGTLKETSSGGVLWIQPGQE